MIATYIFIQASSHAVNMDKKELRNFIRLQKRQFNHEQLTEMSVSIIERLTMHPRVVVADTLFIYYSLNDEVNTHQFINTLVERGKKVLLPAVISDTEIELREYHGKKDLLEGFFNIMEPIGNTFNDYSAIDVAIVPGMAFDSRGNRLGRGKGYYDRFLSKLPDAYKIGLCFAFQKLPGIPTEENDIRMDEVISL